MVRRTGRRPVDPDSPVVDLDRVLADDRLIDELAHPARPDGGPPAAPARTAGAHRSTGRHRCGRTEPLLELLDEWRAELSARPLPATLVLPAPVPSVPSMREVPRSRTLRPMLAVAAAIGAVVIGSATISAPDADPNSLLWPVTQALWPDRAASVESARAVRSALADARAALDAGRPGDAQDALRRASDALAQVPAGDEHDGMWQQVVALSVSAAPSTTSAGATLGPFPVAGGIVPAAGTIGGAAGQPDGAAAASPAAVQTATGAGHLPAFGHVAQSAGPSASSTTSNPGSSTGSPQPGGVSAGPVPAGASVGETSAPGTESPAPTSTPAAATPTPPPVTTTPTTATTEPSGVTSSSPAATQQSAPSPTATTSGPPSSSQSPALIPYDLDPADSGGASADAATDGSASGEAATAGSGG